MKTFGFSPPESAVTYLAPLLWPRDDLSGCEFIPDGAAHLDERGRLVAQGRCDAILSRFPNHRREELSGILAPAFADMHLHWVQHRVEGRYCGQLLAWLNDHIYPAEAELLDPELRAKAADTFWRDLIRAGTLTSAIFASSFEAGVDDCLCRAVGVHCCGNAIMTGACPPVLCQEPATVLPGARGLFGRWGRGYAVSPRFAVSVEEGTMAALGRFAREGDLVVQTHLAENPGEVDQVARNFPEVPSYAQVYDRSGLLGTRSILAHCVHLDDEDWQLLAARRCLVAHCPSSNIALESGRMDLESVRRHGIDWVLASDIGAGPDICMLEVMRSFLQVHAGECDVTPGEAFAHAGICAVPERFTPPDVPARLVLLADNGPGAGVDDMISALIDSYQGDPATVILGVNFGGRWLEVGKGLDPRINADEF